MEGTSSNIKCFDANAANSSRYEEVNSNVRSPGVRSDPDSLYYDMSGDKFLIIFNHYEFKRTMRFRCRRPSTREGTFKDVNSLKKEFEKHDFKVIVHQDLTRKDILKQVSTFCSWDHSNTSCVFVAILTHGDAGGKLFAADRPYLFSDVKTFFENGQDGLVTKPKVFIVQYNFAIWAALTYETSYIVLPTSILSSVWLGTSTASSSHLTGGDPKLRLLNACRGAYMDAGRRVQLDGESSSVLQAPSHSDFFKLLSSVDGEESYDPGPQNLFTCCLGFIS